MSMSFFFSLRDAPRTASVTMTVKRLPPGPIPGSACEVSA
jgi:hypothetical protein